MKSTKVFEVHWMEPGEKFKKKNTHIWGAMAKRKIIWNPVKTVFSGGTHRKTNLPFEGKSTLMHFQTSKRILNLKDMLRGPFTQLPIWGLFEATTDVRAYFATFRNLRVAGSSSGAKTSPGNTYKRLVLLVDFHRIVNVQTYYSPTRL